MSGKSEIEHELFKVMADKAKITPFLRIGICHASMSKHENLAKIKRLVMRENTESLSPPLKRWCQRWLRNVCASERENWSQNNQKRFYEEEQR
jgi:hypothetical protein